MCCSAGCSLRKVYLGHWSRKCHIGREICSQRKAFIEQALLGGYFSLLFSFSAAYFYTMHNKENIWNSVVSCLDNLSIASRETRCAWGGETGRWLQMIRRKQLSSLPSVRFLLYLAVCRALLTILFFHTVLPSSIQKTCNSFSWRQQNTSGLSFACG